MTCQFNVGDEVDFKGTCFPVVDKQPLGSDFILRLRADNGATFPVDCSAVSACRRVAALAAPMAGPPTTLPPRPKGLAEIVRVFGDPKLFVEHKERWESLSLDSATLGQPLPYAYANGVSITRIRGHRLVVEHLAATLMDCLSRGVPAKRLKYGGCYQWRSKRGVAELSTHTWGIAVDIEPAENPMNVPWRDDGRCLDKRVIDTFEERGWLWGGRFTSGVDPMHFQWASQY